MKADDGRREDGSPFPHDAQFAQLQLSNMLNASSNILVHCLDSHGREHRPIFSWEELKVG